MRRLESELESVGAKYREQKLNDREKDIKLQHMLVEIETLTLIIKEKDLLIHA